MTSQYIQPVLEFFHARLFNRNCLGDGWLIFYFPFRLVNTEEIYGMVFSTQMKISFPTGSVARWQTIHDRCRYQDVSIKLAAFTLDSRSRVDRVAVVSNSITVYVD